MFLSIKICSVIILIDLNPACSFWSFLFTPILISLAASRLASRAVSIAQISNREYFGRQVLFSTLHATSLFSKACYNMWSVYLRYVPCQRLVGSGLFHPLLIIYLSLSSVHSPPHALNTFLNLVPQTRPSLLSRLLLIVSFLSHLFLTFHLSVLPISKIFRLFLSSVPLICPLRLPLVSSVSWLSFWLWRIVPRFCHQ